MGEQARDHTTKTANTRVVAMRRAVRYTRSVRSIDKQKPGTEYVEA